MRRANADRIGGVLLTQSIGQSFDVRHIHGNLVVRSHFDRLRTGESGRLGHIDDQIDSMRTADLLHLVESASQRASLAQARRVVNDEAGRNLLGR